MDDWNDEDEDLAEPAAVAEEAGGCGAGEMISSLRSDDPGERRAGEGGNDERSLSRTGTSPVAAAQSQVKVCIEKYLYILLGELAERCWTIRYARFSIYNTFDLLCRMTW